ncbi:MAG: hypothetical protein FJ291_21045 [Planctomycetes bacterium]|nr:hypothetical protein [Planctomycetota bacterium]
MRKRNRLAIVGLFVAAAVLAAEALPPRGMPAHLRGMASEAREALGQIHKIVEQQRALAQQAPRAKNAEAREAIFQQIRGNLKRIAELRVRILEIQAARARARLEWARDHAAQLRLSHVVLAMKQFGGGPRAPEAPATNGPLAGAKRKVEEALSRVEALRQKAAKAASDQERANIRQEIEEQLRIVENQRVAGFEAIVSALDERLAWARRQAAEEEEKR